MKHEDRLRLIREAAQKLLSAHRRRIEDLKTDPGVRWKLLPETAYELYRQGFTQTAIAEALGLHRQQITYYIKVWLQRSSAPRRPKRSEPTREELIQKATLAGQAAAAESSYITSAWERKLYEEGIRDAILWGWGIKL